MFQVILKNKKEYLSLSKLYERYFSDVFKYSFSILKNYEEAQDAAQEVFVRYAENEKTFKGDCSQKTWLLIIARNYCYNKVKSKNLNNERIDEEIFNNTIDVDYETKISLRDALMKLPEEYNEVVYLKMYEGYSYKEISGMTGLTIENVKIKLFRAKQKLRKLLTGKY